MIIYVITRYTSKKCDKVYDGNLQTSQTMFTKDVLWHWQNQNNVSFRVGNSQQDHFGLSKFTTH